MPSPPEPVRVFYSYAHEDQALREQLAGALSPLRRQGLITDSHDRCITGGREWANEIDDHLDSAELVLLLISNDFIGSDYCQDVELKRAMARHRAGEARVMPVFLRPTYLKGAEFTKLQGFPTDAVPVTSWSDRDAAWLDVVEGIEKVAQEILAQRPASDSSSPLPLSDRPDLRDAYLRLMAAEWRLLPLEALSSRDADAGAKRITLEQVYVDLDTTTPRPKGPEKDQEQSFDREKPLSAVEALAQAARRRMVLLGQPGSGKSTFARHLALCMAEALSEPATHALARSLPDWDGGPCVPVFVSLGRLAAALPVEAKQGTAGQVKDFICQQVDGRETLAGFGAPLLATLEQEGGLVIFDGLDEVSGARRGLIRQAVGEFAELHPRCSILLTCRTHSYRQDLGWQLPWAAEHQLADFDAEKIEAFIDGWYQAQARLNPGSPVDYGGKARTLKQALGPEDRRGLRDLAGTPLLLTVMAIVHTKKELPDSRVGVYRECVEILLERWQKQKEGIPLLEALRPYRVTSRQLNQGIREMAFKAHGSGERSESGGRALVGEFTVHGVLFKRLGGQGLEVFLDYCRHANGLLLAERVVADGSGEEVAYRYVFPHLSFEEYLAAHHLAQTRDGLKEAVKLAADPAWREVARFLGEHLCHDEHFGDPDKAIVLLGRLCPSCDPMGDGDWRRIWLAGELLPHLWQELRDEDRDSDLDERIRKKLVSLLQSRSALANAPADRAAAGRALARVGDPRPGVGVRADGLPDIVWVRIPGTEWARQRFRGFKQFRMGDAGPSFEINDFCLAMYPVTVAQYRVFLEQTGRPPPLFWDDPYWTLDNHPVIGVDWHDAAAYGEWLTERLRAVGELTANEVIRLPSEAEWEWAASGPEGRRYPWGDQVPQGRCDYLYSGIGRTSALGIFPGGAADWWVEKGSGAEILHDLAGNIWEWTGTEWSEDYAGSNQISKNRASGPRVVRGGAWNNNARGVRAARRKFRPPADRDDNLGFRPARTLSI